MVLKQAKVLMLIGLKPELPLGSIDKASQFARPYGLQWICGLAQVKRLLTKHFEGFYGINRCGTIGGTCEIHLS